MVQAYSNEWHRLDLPTRSMIERHQAEPKVQLREIALELDLRVKSAILPSDIAGKILHDDDGYVIRVNREHPKVRQRFTVAHEISHFLLHKELIGDGIEDDPLYRSGLPDEREWEANRLAADIVLPLKNLKTLLGGRNRHSERVISDIATCACVSSDVVKIRLGVPL